jgi:MFS family permease
VHAASLQRLRQRSNNSSTRAAYQGICAFLIREPHRAVPPADAIDQSFAALRLHLRTYRRFYWRFFAGFVLSNSFIYGVTAWAPTYMHRAFGMSYTEIGLTMAGALLLGTALASPIAGWITDYLYVRGMTDAPIRMFTIAILIGSLAATFEFLSHDKTLFIISIYVCYMTAANPLTFSMTAI